MFLNENEEKIIKNFYVNINTYEREIMKLKWDNENSVEAIFDTCFEDDNDLDMNDEMYEEYMTFIFKVCKRNGNPPIYITEDKYFCINYHNFPKEILVNGKKIN